MNIKRHIYHCSWATLVGTYIVFITAFFLAYTNPTKQVILDINKYGEANIEALMFILTIPFSLHILYDTIKLIKNKSIYKQGLK